ncbi:hypothetical protein KQX54_012501 [Cotesia glomerata]|uniref:HAT C-terminal dimerisation domain-containing protein n=1 Tax=Cotesia glomerata TaxID=32391 RepID=A0AAV7IF33_COTGL|nr:hypothetical protein KQX54_012501 [Cotesia glomerata]
MWALIKWVGGEDDKKMTAGININHIKNFNCEQFLNDDLDPDKVYVIEWRDTKKMPLGGWNCYLGKVLAVSHSIKILEKKIDIMDGIRSPRRIVCEVDIENVTASISDSEDDTRIETNNSELEGQNSKKKLRFSTNEDEIQFIESTSDETATDPKKSNENLSNSNVTNTATKSTEAPVSTQFVTKEYFDKTMRKVKNFMKLATESKSFNMDKKFSLSKNKKSEIKKRTERAQVELGHEGSGVFIERYQWDAALRANSFMSMAISLLCSAFSEEGLLVKSVKAHHDDFKEGPFGTAINNKCGKLRTLARKAEKEKENQQKPDEAAVSSQEKSYTARTLAEMYNDHTNILYFLDDVLREVTRVNLAFQARRIFAPAFLRHETTNTDNAMLHLADINAVKKALEKTVGNFGNSLLPLDSIDFGERFKSHAAKNLVTRYALENVKQRCLDFLIVLCEQLVLRLPENLAVLSNLRFFTPAMSLSQSLIISADDLPWELSAEGADRDLIRIQWRQLRTLRLHDISIEFDNNVEITKFWIAVWNLRDASGNQSFKELASFAIRALSSPISNADVERVFSVMSIVKTKLRNRMLLPMLVALSDGALIESLNLIEAGEIDL